jgi:sugar lactone lactonase YvrE
MQWLNTEGPLTIRQLRGKIVVIDFWTYCCINCMHIIPDLQRLEKKYAAELVVIGVHSAKFTEERQERNIREAVLRYEIEHPVLNDSEMAVWSLYGARAWPTVVLIDPEGRIVGVHSGEGVYEPFDQAIAKLVKEYGDRIDRKPLKLALEKDRQGETLLRFPGKVLADEAGKRLFIADSNHNRVVIVSLEDSAVSAVIGSGSAGMDDGEFAKATFHRPQGMALRGQVLYVADTENHAIRAVDLEKRQVTTVAGTGRQAKAAEAGGPARQTDLSSPWDVVAIGDSLYIAMAGTHQIWRLDLARGAAEPYAGTGREARIDGPLAAAALAQPFGMATDGRKLYFADSEVSSIRSADLAPGGRVTTIVGGDLFDFGDRDGTGLSVRLQHPLAVAYADETLYVADTYNNKIKSIRLSDGSCRTLFGGEQGMRDGEEPRFNEPGGVSLAGGKLYIADTNNHVIRVADLKSGRVETLALKEMARLRPAKEARKFSGQTVELAAQRVEPGEVKLTIRLNLPDGYKLNAEAPNAVVIATTDAKAVAVGEEGRATVQNPRYPAVSVLRTAPGRADVTVDYVIYYCAAGKESLCYFKEVRLKLPVVVEADAGQGQGQGPGQRQKALDVSYDLPAPGEIIPP